jgi:ribosome-associated protein
MDIRKLQRVIVDGLEDVKAQHIAVFNTEHLSALFERVIIASGTSNRQTKSLASSVREAVKTAGFPVPRTEGEANGEWIIIDCGAAVVHVMQPTIRDYYHLEEIWGDKPVNMKLTSATTKLVKAAEPEAPAKRSAAGKAPAKAAPAKKPVAKKAPAPAAATRKVAAKKTAPTRTAAAKVPARKAPAKRAAAPTRLVTRVVGVKKAPAKKAAARTSAPAKKPAAKKVARKA